MRYSLLAALAVAILADAGCGNRLVGGAVIGAGTAAVAYEFYNEEAMDDLEEAYEDGEISRGEYERRREEIDERSVVQ